MTVLFYSTLDDPAEWLPRLRGLMPKEDFVVWPEIGDPRTVDVALLLMQPPGGLGAFTALRVVQSLGAGVNQLALDTMPPGVRVARLVDPGLTERMAEYCLLAILRYHRSFDVFERVQRAGAWAYRLPEPRSGYPIGIMGLGEIGGAVARRLAANQFTVRGWSRRPKQIADVACFTGEHGLPAFLRGLRALICVLPLTPATEGILSARLFEQLAPGAVLINVGRGLHLVEDDLLAALQSGQLTGATLDVFREEPLPANHPFWSHKLILMTPHVAGAGDPDTAAGLVVENIRRARAGAPLLHELDRERGY
jgi:glyoxylate/hydroxypyruvate reductase A